MVQYITEIEKDLLKLLVRNSRWNLSILSHQMGKSRNWVSRTVQQLVQKQAIRAYVTVVDPGQVYSERSTLLLIRTNPRETHVSQALLGLPELEFLDGITGEYSLLGHFRVRNVASFEGFLDQVDSIISHSSEGKYKLIQVLTTYKRHGFPVYTGEKENGKLSDSDLDMLRIVSRYAPTPDRPGPLSQEEIGKLMKKPLSQPAVSKAMTRLELQKVIIGYSIDLDFNNINLPVKFFLQVKPRPGTVAETAQKISENDAIWDLYRISEEYSLFATVRTDSVQTYNKFLRGLYEDENVQDTRSQVSLEEWFVPI